MLERLGFIGAGRMAREHARVATAIGAQVDVVLVPNTESPNVSEFRKVVPGARFVSSEKAFRESGMEAIVVVAPWHVIPDMMTNLLEDDRPMLIEKPIILGRKAAWDVAGLADVIGEAPAIVLVCATSPGFRESVIPATQNLLLSARVLGIGGTITSLHASVTDEVRGLLGIPESVDVVYCVPLGYPKGNFGPVTRKPLAEVVSVDAWGNSPELL